MPRGSCSSTIAPSPTSPEPPSASAEAPLEPLLSGGRVLHQQMRWSTPSPPVVGARQTMAGASRTSAGAGPVLCSVGRATRRRRRRWEEGVDQARGPRSPTSQQHQASTPPLPSWISGNTIVGIHFHLRKAYFGPSSVGIHFPSGKAYFHLTMARNTFSLL